MIQTFADSETERFYTAGESRRMPPEIRKRAAMRLLQYNAATQIGDLRLPPSNRLEQLHGDRAGQWSMPSMTSGAYASVLRAAMHLK